MDEIIAFRVAGLTDRQRRLLRLAAAGATVAEMAGHLGLSPHGARREVLALLATLGVRSTAEAALLWWGSRAGARADVAVAAQALVA